VAGRTGTSLATKLGITVDSRLVLLRAPPDLVLDVAPGVTVTRQVHGHADVVLGFFTALAEVRDRVDPMGSMIFPDGGLWVAWPKQTSGRTTDITDHGVRDVALPRGLVDNKVCAVDGTWTALRFVWRRERRGPEADPRRPGY
jgi:hypothetical protein